MVPEWLHILSIVSLVLGLGSALWLAVDLSRHPQHMWIMNVVWPATALFGHVLALWGYYAYGRLAAEERVEAAGARDETQPHRRRTPFPASVGKGVAHCGAGCTLGDIVAESLVFLVPAVAVWAGWKSLFADKIFAIWVVDYVFAFSFGIAFQYFTIKPMRGLTVGEGLVEAIKADAASLTAWQVGMYGFMALAHFVIFAGLLGVELRSDSVEFWFMMQIAMLFGFATAYPVNWWLIRRGVKEAM
ncbi:DUF4396 domain-containing protein [Oceanibacterium hippocampi]|uniref:DUF4396 domain-containing protein n=1 Tax=Oceanibacterium hippocampi TaxID=745714 RepID=A0A1Y5SD72_9PROT|nr:DUF4396 domain-containing protein [Oceanibacterium hippocampi]SLN38021.1 hypothetical protein OCH7691_01561 [Oceanibacterium hippocampi]